MNKIGNIVTSGKASLYSELFNVVKSYDSIIKDLPTLIIGWENAKKWIDGANILNKEYGDVYWTFSKTERRCDYEEDVIKFYNTAILKRMENVKYIYVNPLTFGVRKLIKVIKFLGGDDKKTLFFTRDSQFLFVYSNLYNTVFGISLTLVEYLGIPKKKVIRLIKNGDMITDTSFVSGDIRRVIGSNTHYILPLYEYFRK